MRNQLKSVFSKTGTHRQVELVSLILSMPVGYDRLNCSDTRKGETVSNGEMGISSKTLRDGRLLEYREYGDPSGYIKDEYTLSERGVLNGYSFDIHRNFRIVPMLGWSSWDLVTEEGALPGPERELEFNGTDNTYGRLQF